jgi:NADP-dependent 3-hydroxy acid dehydrogenase YdfG
MRCKAVSFQTSGRADLSKGRIAVVTGASSGIGRAIALELSRHGLSLCLIGRDSNRLAKTVAAARQYSKAEGFQLDLTVEQNINPLIRYLHKTSNRVDVLVHSAGIIRQSLLSSASIKDFDLQYAINVRAPYILTQRLLPLLTRARGQVVFINSSAGLTAKRPDVGQYSATKHAIKAIADSLREEINQSGVRVLTMYLGRTATAMQKSICRAEGRRYYPEFLLQAEDVASVLVHTLLLPATAEVTDISIRPAIKCQL